MNQRVKTIADEIRRLTPAEREDLFGQLGWYDDGGADGTPEEIDAAWMEEVERRAQSYAQGEIQGIPAEIVIAEMRAKLKHT
jgi:putative addiction module component (TIGR02574 family)